MSGISTMHSEVNQLPALTEEQLLLEAGVTETAINLIGGQMNAQARAALAYRINGDQHAPTGVEDFDLTVTDGEKSSRLALGPDTLRIPGSEKVARLYEEATQAISEAVRRRLNGSLVE